MNFSLQLCVSSRGYDRVGRAGEQLKCTCWKEIKAAGYLEDLPHVGICG